MLKSIYVTVKTHPELYNQDLNLILDTDGDLIFINPEKKLIYRLLGSIDLSVIRVDDRPELSYIFDLEGVK